MPVRSVEEDTSDAATATATGRSTPKRRRLRTKRLVLGLAPMVGFVVLWWYVTTFVLDRPRIYPPPGDVLDALLTILSGDAELGSSYAHFAATLYRLVASFLVAFVLGTLLGVVAGRRKAVFDFVGNLGWIAMAVPSVVWVFIFVIALGISNAVPIAALAVILTPPVMLAVAEGTKAIPTDLTTMASSFKVEGPQLLFELYLPSVVPYMASSARVIFALGIKIVIIAEVIGLPSGIGLLLKYWFDSLFMAPVVAWGIILIGVGFVGDQLVFGPLERRASRWSDRDSETLAAIE